MGSSPAGTSVLLSPEPVQPVTVQTQCPPGARASHSWDPAIGAAELSCVPQAPGPSPALPKTPALVSSYPELCSCFSPLTSASRPRRPSMSTPRHLEHVRKRPPRKCIKAGVLQSPPPPPQGTGASQPPGFSSGSGFPAPHKRPRKQKREAPTSLTRWGRSRGQKRTLADSAEQTSEPGG